MSLIVRLFHSGIDLVKIINDTGRWILDNENVPYHTRILPVRMVAHTRMGNFACPIRVWLPRTHMGIGQSVITNECMCGVRVRGLIVTFEVLESSIIVPMVL